jgi:hypothetical protein
MPIPYACCADVPFENLVRFFTCFGATKQNQLKERHLAEFRSKNVPRPSADIYQIYRLLLPAVGGAGLGAAERLTLYGGRGAIACA